MRIGDKVKWTSQAGGVLKTKEGEIICIVPAGTPVFEAYPNIRNSNSTWGGGTGRDHESYVVKVGKKLYWPLVKNLRMSESDAVLPIVNEILSEEKLDNRAKWPAWMTN